LNTALLAAEQTLAKVHTQADKDAFFKLLEDMEAKAKETGESIANLTDPMRAKAREQVEEFTKAFEAGGQAILQEQFQLARLRVQNLQVQYRAEQQLDDAKGHPANAGQGLLGQRAAGAEGLLRQPAQGDSGQPPVRAEAIQQGSAG
jgi:hypothetical protein